MTLTLDQAAALLDQPSPAVPGQLAVDMGPRIGSLCTGYGGLDAAVQAVFGGTVAWVSDIDPGASAILAHHHPDVPNIGDLTATDWAEVEPVDIVCGGYPCQPFSAAGQRKGTADARHIWPYIATALRVLRPRIAVFENVSNHLRLGFDTVLADLAEIGFDADWCLVRASEVGAPHRRERLFVLAWPADTGSPGLARRWAEGATPDGGGTAEDPDGAARHQRRITAPGQAESGRPRPDAGGRGGAPAADAARDGHGDAGAARKRGLPAAAVAGRPSVAADAASLGRREGRPEPEGQQGRLRAAVSGGAPAADADGGRLQGGPAVDRREPALPAADVDRPGVQWGAFAPAIARWEEVQGRPAPRAVDDRGRLSPVFVEWMMGLPDGHVTAVPGLSRTAQLKALGNGVVPCQAEAALRLLADRAGAAR